ncbi:MAG: carboxypeptidase-like regulatory domain-containing protein [Solirubrobacteraceae bacterium]
MVAALLAAIAMGAPAAQADQMTVFSCHNPAGHAIGHYGWLQERFLSGSGVVLNDTCAGSGQGALVAELGGRREGYADAERVQWTFSAPSWATIAHYTLHLPDSYTYPFQGAGEGQAFVIASDESDPMYDYRNLGAGSYGAATVERAPPDEVHFVTVNASCDGYVGVCPAGPLISHVDMSEATFLLNDSTLPTVKNVGGSLLGGSPLAGPAEATFQASDSGPGIYSAHFIVDAVAQPLVVLDSNNGLCQNLGETSNGTRSFQSPEPCAKTVEGALTLETAHWPDGSHHVELVVEDASGNQVTAYDGTVVFHNASNSSLGAPNGPGASASSSATPSAGAANGSAASESATLRLGVGRRISRSYARRAFTLRGRLLSKQGQPIEGATLDILQQTLGGEQTQLIAHATTGADGSFAVKVAGGPSRTVEVGYRAFANDATYAAEAEINESVRAAVRLHVSRRSTSPTGTIVLSGRVLGPIPKNGVLAELLVYYRGRWEPFRTPRTNSKGRFRVVYQFEGAVGRFPFKAEIPDGQAGFAFSTGYSAHVSVATD